MKQQTGSILLVAGTCIGSGMIALPLVLAQLGLLLSLAVMLLVWFFMYYSSLIHLELNLQAKKGLSLGALAYHFSGFKAGWIGTISLKLLSYSLLAVFLYGSASIVAKIIPLTEIGNSQLTTYCAAISFLLLLLPLKGIDYLNRLLFTALVSVALILILGLTTHIQWSKLPLFPSFNGHFSQALLVLPVVFTSFGFHVIFHTLTDYCKRNPVMLKKAFFWGSLIPALFYMIWTGSVLSIVYRHNPDFYSRMARGQVEIGDLILQLSSIAEWPVIQLLVGWISLLAIVTSILGVGMGLCQTLEKMIVLKMNSKVGSRLFAALLTILPPYLVALLVPNAFILVLGFAGMILAVIAILLPTYLLKKGDFKELYYQALQAKKTIYCASSFAMLIILCELLNVIKG